MKNHQPFLLFLLLLVCQPLCAQEFWIKGGMNYNQLRPVNQLPGYTFYPTQDFYAGAITDIPFNDQFALQTGLGVSAKGYRYTAGNGTFTENGEINFIFLELPIHLQYKIPVWDDLSFFTGAGSYLALDPFWSIWRGEALGDFGLSASLGLEYYWVQLGAYFDQGLAHIKVSQEEIMRTQVFSVRLGIRL